MKERLRNPLRAYASSAYDVDTRTGVYCVAVYDGNRRTRFIEGDEFPSSKDRIGLMAVTTAMEECQGERRLVIGTDSEYAYGSLVLAEDRRKNRDLVKRYKECTSKRTTMVLMENNRRMIDVHKEAERLLRQKS